jgi:hypothetical protein
MAVRHTMDAVPALFCLPELILFSRDTLGGMLILQASKHRARPLAVSLILQISRFSYTCPVCNVN